VTSGTSLNVSVANSESDYTFTVTAKNKAGGSGTSAASQPIRAAGKPAMVAAPTATLVNTGGDGGRIDVRFPVLTAEQRNGSTVNEISYRYRLTSGNGSGAIPAGGGVVAAPNGTPTAVVVWAVSSSSSTAGDASSKSNTVNPYGLAFAPTVSGDNKPTGARSVSWTWNEPNGNGRAVTGYQYSLDGGGWQNTTAKSFSTGAGYGETHELRVRAISAGQPGRIGKDTSRSGAQPAPPKPTSWDIRATPVRTCTEPSRFTDSYRDTNPDQCISPGKWFDTGITAQADYYVRWGTSGRLWYHLTSGPAAGNFARGDTTSLGANPPSGMPQR
jgi:large repetitive protein